MRLAQEQKPEDKEDERKERLEREKFMKQQKKLEASIERSLISRFMRRLRSGSSTGRFSTPSPYATAARPSISSPGVADSLDRAKRKQILQAVEQSRNAAFIKKINDTDQELRFRALSQTGRADAVSAPDGTLGALNNEATKMSEHTFPSTGSDRPITLQAVVRRAAEAEDARLNLDTSGGNIHGSDRTYTAQSSSYQTGDDTITSAVSSHEVRLNNYSVIRMTSGDRVPAPLSATAPTSISSNTILTENAMKTSTAMSNREDTKHEGESSGTRVE